MQVTPRWLSLIAVLSVSVACSVDRSGLRVSPLGDDGGGESQPASALDAEPQPDAPMPGTGGSAGSGDPVATGGSAGDGGSTTEGTGGDTPIDAPAATGGVSSSGGISGVDAVLSSGGISGTGGTPPSGGEDGAGGLAQPDASSPAETSSDVPPAPTPESICADQGGKHQNGTCVFDCWADGACGSKVTCPSEQACRVNCGSDACAQGVDCSKATSCNITCGILGSTAACAGPVKCGGTTCTVACNHPGSCKGGVSGNAGKVIIGCFGKDGCAAGVECRSDDCDVYCNGEGSCAGGVNANAATSTIRCAGLNSCEHTVNCSATKCVVSCTGGGERNCAGRVYCNYGDPTSTCPRQ